MADISLSLFFSLSLSLVRPEAVLPDRALSKVLAFSASLSPVSLSLHTHAHARRVLIDWLLYT